MDLFKAAMVLVRGEDAEILAMSLAQVGYIYFDILHSKIRGKECFKVRKIKVIIFPEPRSRVGWVGYSPSWLPKIVYQKCNKKQILGIWGAFFVP